MSALAAIPEKVSDGLSPVMVKELRQAVRSGFVATALVALLIVQLGVITAFLLFGRIATSNLRAGQELFIALQSILIVACMLFIPFYTAVKLAAERASDHTDMMFITTMKPFTIASGKLLAGTVLALVFFAASMPFMFATYLMRGIDIPSMFVTLSAGLLMVMGAIAGAITAACMPVSLRTRILLAVVLALALILLAAIGVSVLGYMATSGVGDKMGTWTFWPLAAAVLLLSAELVGLLTMLAAASFAPQPSNRMLPVRVFLTAAWLGTGLASAVAAWVVSSGWPIVVWAFLHILIVGVALLIGVCEREHWGPRVRRQIPVRKFRRVAAFPLFTGWPNAVAWCLLMMAATIFATVASGVILMGLDSIMLIFGAVQLGTLGVNAYAISITALLIRKAFLAEKVKPSMTWLMALGLGLLVLLLPALLGFLLGRLISGSVTGGLIGMGFASLLSPYFSGFVGGVWALVVGGLSLPWFIKCCQAFKPYRTTPPPPSPVMLAQAQQAKVQMYG